MQYRQDIQVMRGVAVLLVVFFHLNLPGLANGFLGVDVFFVISGFLMALLYQRGMTVEFYRRRAKRLLPAYFFVVMTTITVSAWLTLPAEHVQVVEQGIFASVFSSNIGFWSQNSYFSKAGFNPLLHLWSLGVEIQFYLLVPALFWLNFRSRFVLPFLFFCSLLGCLAMVTVSPKTAFFWVFFRAWQFLFGMAVAQYFTVQGAVVSPRPFLGMTALTALVALVAFFPVDGQRVDPLLGHPGGAAMFVTVVTGVILACGLPQGFQRNFIGSIFQRLGDWSYSIYLVHFPIIVLCLYRPFSGTLLSPGGIGEMLLIMVLIAVFAAISYRFFERRTNWIGHSGPWATIGCVTIIISLSLSSVLLNRWPHSDLELNVFSASSDRDEFRCGKLERILNPGSLACELTKGLAKNSRSLLLVGDSHADAMKSVFVKRAYARGYKVFFLTSNDPLIGGLDQDRVFALAKSLNVSGVAMHYSIGGNSDKAYASGFAEKARGYGLPVVWLLPVPVYRENVPKLIWDNFSAGAGFKAQPYMTEETEAFRVKLIQAGIKTFDAYSAFCTDMCDVMDSDMRPFYFDSSHLTLTGAERLHSIIEEMLDFLTENRNLTISRRPVFDNRESVAK